MMPPTGASSALSMMVMPMPPAGAAALNLLLHILHPLPVSPYYVPNMPYPIKINLQFVDLPQYIVEPGYLGISDRNRIACPVVLLLRYHL
jgi:hypothetical protein